MGQRESGVVRWRGLLRSSAQACCTLNSNTGPRHCHINLLSHFTLVNVWHYYRQSGIRTVRQTRSPNLRLLSLSTTQPSLYFLLPSRHATHETNLPVLYAMRQDRAVHPSVSSHCHLLNVATLAWYGLASYIYPQRALPSRACT